jgi:glycosyltransferase involved in cell wall biosynthesis
MDLLCFSHIRWNFVYQRPQHLMSRFALYNRVFIIEEPKIGGDTDYYEINKDATGHNLWIVNLYISKDNSPEKINSMLKALLDSMVFNNSIKNYLAWYYTPMALAYSDHLHPSLIVYDCMDELSAFKFAPPELKKLETELFKCADLVFTGGHSLYNAKKKLHANIHSFPSSIDKAHFHSARIKETEPADQLNIPHPRFGFYGVIDERFHISLIDQLSSLRPGWQFIFIGPIIKIDPASLPAKDNIHYLGSKTYQELPAYLSGWDIAILPFELNESTRYISPTKTPEYLAGGKPVISTSINDVVSPYGDLGLVHIADTAEEFVTAAEKIFSEEDRTEWKAKVDKHLEGLSWNKTWHDMTALIEEALENKVGTITKKSAIYV